MKMNFFQNLFDMFRQILMGKIRWITNTTSSLPRKAHKLVHVTKNVSLLPEERTIIIGDVHGCYDELQELLLKCNVNKKDTIIYVGDLVNKGPKSLEVVQFVRSSGALCVLGNHDQAALEAYRKRRDILKTNQSKWNKSMENEMKELHRYSYTDSFSSKDIEFLENLPSTISIPQHNAIIVHAGLIPGISLENQTIKNMYKMRNLVKKDTEKDNSIIKWNASERSDEGMAWASIWSGPQHVYFGHDAKRLLQDHPFATGLDTGCCYGKELTAMILPTKKIVSVKARHVYEAPKS